MARLLLLLVSASATLAVAFAVCAFPQQGCMKSVCDTLSTTQYNLLLHNDTFNFRDKQRLGDWSNVPRLGHFFGNYNPLFNGGKYDKTKWAVRDGAPCLNYFQKRTDRGIYNKNGYTLAKCCNLCRVTPGCFMYMFDPQWTWTNPMDPDDPDYDYYKQGERFFPGGGDCSLLLQNNYTYDEVNGFCTNEGMSEDDYYDPTVKPLFYGGLCSASASDDPHFVGARGTHFDFNGELDKSFCLVADTRIQVNALLRGYRDPRAEAGIRSWMKELGLVWLDDAGVRHTLLLVARAGPQRERGDGFLVSVVLDGVSIPAPYSAPYEQGGVHFNFEGVRQRGPYDVDMFRLKIDSLLDVGISMRVAHPLLQTPSESEVHFNLVFHSMQGSDQVHGVLGQTYRTTASQVTRAVEYSLLARILGGPVQADGETGRGFLDGSVKDYVTSTPLATDCKFSSMP